MYTEVQELIIDNIDPQYKSLSILLWNRVYRDGVKFAESKGYRRAFIPGDVAGVEEFIANCPNKQDALNVINAMWTPEVIEAYTNMMAQNEL